MALEEKNRLKAAALKLLPAAFFALVAAVAYLQVLPETRSQQAPWYGAVVTPEEVAAALWVDATVPRKSLFAADLFACEMLASAGGMVCSVGGAWELADRANQRFQDNERVFVTADAREAHDLLARYGIEYVFLHPRTSFYAFGWKPPEMAKFGDAAFFRPVYEGGGVKIYSVNPG